MQEKYVIAEKYRNDAEHQGLDYCSLSLFCPIHLEDSEMVMDILREMDENFDRYIEPRSSKYIKIFIKYPIDVELDLSSTDNPEILELDYVDDVKYPTLARLNSIPVYVVANHFEKLDK